MYLAYGTRASDRGPNAGEFDNTKVMEDILQVRLVQAHLLDFENFSELSLERKMARSGEEVLVFLSELASQARPAATRELAEIEAFAAAQGTVLPLNSWNIAFFAEKLKKASFDISDEEMRPIFPLIRSSRSCSRSSGDCLILPSRPSLIWLLGIRK